MAIGAIVGVWGAPNADVVAGVLRDSLGGVLTPGVGDGWILRHAEWDITIDESTEPDMAPVSAGTDHRQIRGRIEELWSLLNAMFDSLAAATSWGLHAHSELDDEFPARFRAGGGVTRPPF